VQSSAQSLTRDIVAITPTPAPTLSLISEVSASVLKLAERQKMKIRDSAECEYALVPRRVVLYTA
jgi:hypothetical protein